MNIKNKRIKNFKCGTTIKLFQYKNWKYYFVFWVTWLLISGYMLHVFPEVFSTHWPHFHDGIKMTDSLLYHTGNKIRLNIFYVKCWVIKGAFSNLGSMQGFACVSRSLRKTTEEPKCADYTVNHAPHRRNGETRQQGGFSWAFLVDSIVFLLEEQRTECYFSIIFFVTYKNKAL